MEADEEAVEVAEVREGRRGRDGGEQQRGQRRRREERERQVRRRARLWSGRVAVAPGEVDHAGGGVMGAAVSLRRRGATPWRRTSVALAVAGAAGWFRNCPWSREPRMGKSSSGLCARRGHRSFRAGGGRCRPIVWGPRRSR